jgi:poly-beta-1,6-N-acetyl-D-glucosamine synthase
MLTAAGQQGGQAGVGLYWRYEKFMRRHESQVDSTLGATGAIYAIRRELFMAIPADTLLDDVLIPARIVRQGYRVIFEPSARGWDRTATAAEEFRRKLRTIAGNFQLFARERWLLDPRINRLWLQTVSHKALRLLTPAWLLMAFMANAALVDRTGYLVTWLAQAAFYAVALVGAAVECRGGRVRGLAFPYVFCLLNAATVLAFFRVVRRRQLVTWEKATPPSATAEDRAA